MLWQTIEGKSFDKMYRVVSEIVSHGYPMSSLLMQLHDDVIFRPNLSDVDKALICEKIAQVRMYLYCTAIYKFAFYVLRIYYITTSILLLHIICLLFILA